MNPIIIDALKTIQTRLSRIVPITYEELILIAPIIHLEHLDPQQFFLRPGENSSKIAFILKGLTKTFYTTENGKEHISHFGSEGNLIGVYTDMLKHVPSSGYIEALEPCTLLTMDYEKLLEVTKDNLNWTKLFLKIAEDRYIYRSDKDRNITLKSAEEKFEYFKETHLDLFDRIPQNQIALYLNLNPATLSRLKNSSGNYRKK